MDKIWYRNSSKKGVIGRCGEDEKLEWPRRTDKRRTLKNYWIKKQGTFSHSPLELFCTHTIKRSSV